MDRLKYMEENNPASNIYSPLPPASSPPVSSSPVSSASVYSSSPQTSSSQYPSPQPSPSQPMPPQPPPPQNQVTAAVNYFDEYASFGKRFLANLVDSLILGTVFFLINFVLGMVGSIVAGPKGGWGSPSLLNPALLSLNYVLTSLLEVGYFVYFIGRWGQTPGKKVLNIKVIRLDDQPIGYLNAFLREIVGKLLSSIVFLLGYFWMIWDKKKQTWHDKIAGTVVINV